MDCLFDVWYYDGFSQPALTLIRAHNCATMEWGSARQTPLGRLVWHILMQGIAVTPCVFPQYSCLCSLGGMIKGFLPQAVFIVVLLDTCTFSTLCACFLLREKRCLVYTCGWKGEEEKQTKEAGQGWIHAIMLCSTVLQELYPYCIQHAVPPIESDPFKWMGHCCNCTRHLVCSTVVQGFSG